jgi:hypothetical protein
LREKEKKDTELKAKQKERERRHQERLFNQKIPDSGRRLTKSAANRAEIVRRALEEEEKVKGQEEKQKKMAAKKEREMGLMLKYLVDERERERKEKLPGEFRELSEAQLKDNVKQAKEAYRFRMAENKKRLQEVILNRPSLLERHEQSVAAKAAGTKALGAVAKAVGGTEFDLFNEDEALKLGVMGA